MARLSAALIVRNESRNLRECLETLRWVDEIVVVDSGSDDDTVAIAREYTDKVYIESDWQGYGVQRQRAQAYTSGDWILMVDADERVSPELRAEIEAVVENDQRQTAYAIPRLSFCFGRFIRHGGWYPDYVVRLYPRESGAYSAAPVHEKVQLAPGVELRRLSGDLLHYTYNDLEHYLVKSAAYAAAWSAMRRDAGQRATLGQGIMHGIACFVRMYLLRAGFLDGRAGFLLALLSAHSTFVKYADLWLRGQRAPRGRPPAGHEPSS